MSAVAGRLGRITRLTYYAATTLDGFLAAPSDSLDWLMRHGVDEDGPFNYSEFIAGVGAIVMGSATYEWVLRTDPAGWSCSIPAWVMTSRPCRCRTAPTCGSPPGRRGRCRTRWRPLLPRRLGLRLVEAERTRAFVGARYEVVGPLIEDG